jgi:hypothetical protein
MIENKMKYATTILTFLIVNMVFVSSVQAIGVTRPVPLAVKLLPGESQVFRFQIQATTSTMDQSCSCSIGGISPPLIVEFEEESGITVSAGGKENVYFTVYVPEDAPLKTYIGELTVRCGDKRESMGITGSLVYSTINSPFSVEVVSFREGEKPEMEIPEELTAIPMETVIVIIIVIVILIAGVYYWSKKSGKKKVKRRAKK